jgi:nitroreductase
VTGTLWGPEEATMTTATERLVDQRTVQLLLEAATRAPSVHNSQPWLFAVGPHRVDLRADPTRRLRAADPSGRSQLISCGAALMNLRVAAEHLGFRPRVRVLPSSTDPTLVAAVQLDYRHSHPGGLATLYPSVATRRTNRQPFADRRVPLSVLTGAIEAVDLEHGLLRIYDDPAEIARLVDLLHAAALQAWQVQPGAADERRAWVGTQRPGEGIPTGSLGPRPADPRQPHRDLAPGPDPEREQTRFERAPTIAILSTRTDTPADWVRAGMALERALLVLTDAGVSASFMNEPLEQADLRWLVRSPTTGVGHPQMVLRIGHGVPVPPTPRRPLADVMLKAS